MRYLLDANAVIALLNDTTSPIARRTRRHAPRDIGLPAIVVHELYYGAFKSQRVDQNAVVLPLNLVMAARMPWSSAVGDGGQPGTSTSTGITFATRPRLA